MGWWHAARPPEPAGPHPRGHAGPNRGVLTRAARRDGSPELTVILTPRNKGPTRRGQGASPGPIRTPLPNGHRNLLSRCCDDHLSPGWKPVWAVLCEETERALALANAAPVKAVPGRKT